ncbi:MAG: hypothetical protein J7518_21215 [Nocardioidaceae bacterium]|nr:hypothetical protein [Nocardioidaceae bacterium]
MHDHHENTKRRRSAPLLWGSGAIAAALLILGVSGTLSTWTTALVHNDVNTTSAQGAVALSESSGGATCVDTATTTTNEATCSTINKYGGSVLDPDGVNSATATVQMTNTGTATGDLTLDADACSTSGGATTSTSNLCDYVQVTVTCDGTVKYGPATLSAFAAAGPATIGTLTPSAATSCTLVVTLPSGSPAGVSGQTALQQLNWTLTKV